MGKGYYDEDEGEYVKGEWLDHEPGKFRDDEFLSGSGDRRTFQSGKPGKTYSFRKKIVLEIDPLRGARIRRDRDAPHKDPYRVESGKGTFSFSETEKRHLTTASIILISAFMIFFHGGIYAGLGELFHWPYILYIGTAAFVSVITGFLTHEMGHKFAAQRMGYWAEFRQSRSGLFFALIVSLFGFIIAAPGAVMIYGRLSKRENGITSLSGPAINTIWATLFYGAIVISRVLHVSGYDLNMFDVASADGLTVGTKVWWTIISYGFLINTIFAGFNLLPIRFLGLDGYKILDWNMLIYFVFVLIVGLFAFLSIGIDVAAIFVILCFGIGLWRKRS